MQYDDLTTDFKEAAGDYRYLIRRGYSRKVVLKLVGDRYALNACQRTMLYRGVFPREESDRRVKQRSSLAEAEALTIDGYNVLITLANYLYGRPVFLGTDGFLRDAGQAYGSLLKGPVFRRAITLLLRSLAAQQGMPVRIIFDRPVPKSGDLAKDIRAAMENLGIHGSAETVTSPDYELKHALTGSVCTSDSVIIDECPVSVCDLSREILDKAFEPEYIDLARLFPKD
ncbi:MAG: DUF434 domain-containing protein [Spirochaetales bacterium]|nr:DUF434 domain-containing protein [Spirochaetales bacterium]